MSIVLERTETSLADVRRVANDVLDMLRTNQWQARIIRGDDPDPLSVPKGGNIEFYFIRQHERLGNLIIRSDHLARALINYNAELLPELEAFKVCHKCQRMHYSPSTEPHSGCALGYLMWKSGEYQVFTARYDGMRLHPAKGDNGILVYKPVHGLLAERIARAAMGLC